MTGSRPHLQIENRKTGLERSFNDLLSGEIVPRYGVDPLVQDSLLDGKTPRQGEDLITSIDIDSRWPPRQHWASAWVCGCPRCAYG